MKRQWNHRDRTPTARATARLRASAAATPLRRRIDAALIVLLILSVTLLSGLWTAGVSLGHRYGIGDPAVIRPIADERLTVNIRDQLAAASLRDAVFHAPERRVYLAQEGGTIHSYDPATHPWTTERPFGAADLITSELTLLRSGCGRDPAALRADACPDPATIWAMSERGGLLRRSGEAWQVVMGDISWSGKRGIPIQGDMIAAAALSADRRWLALGTSADGVGLYDNLRGTWAAQPALRAATANPTTTTTIGWWADRFWIGGPQGWSRSSPTSASRTSPQWPITPALCLILISAPMASICSNGARVARVLPSASGLADSIIQPASRPCCSMSARTTAS